MAGSFTVVINGNVGKDPYINESGDRPFATFSVGYTPYTKDESKRKPIWTKIMVNGPQVQVVKDYVRKGTYVTVTGKVTKLELATDRDGKKVISQATGEPVIELVVQSHEFSLGPKNSSENAPPAKAMSASAGSSAMEDDAPF